MIEFQYCPTTGTKLRCVDGAPAGVVVVRWPNGSDHVVCTPGITRIRIDAAGRHREALGRLLDDIVVPVGVDTEHLRHLRYDVRGVHDVYIEGALAPLVWAVVQRHVPHTQLLDVDGDRSRWTRTIDITTGDATWSIDDPTLVASREGWASAPVPTYRGQSPVAIFGDVIGSMVRSDGAPSWFGRAVRQWAEDSGQSPTAVVKHLQELDVVGDEGTLLNDCETMGVDLSPTVDGFTPIPIPIIRREARP